MNGERLLSRWTSAIGMCAVAVFLSGSRAIAQTEKTLYNFNVISVPGGTSPTSGVILDSGGNLYGTTELGGSGDGEWCGILNGCGVAFELSPQSDGSWTERVLHSFGSGADGANPDGGLSFDGAGNLYGTTYNGGTFGSGTVFEITP